MIPGFKTLKSFSAQIKCMPLSKLFWFLGFLTVIFLGLYVAGYEVLEVIFSLIIVNIAVIEVSRQVDKKKHTESIKNDLTERLASIERICKNIMDHQPRIDHDDVKTIVQEHNKSERDKTDYLFDRMARKSIEIENNVNRMKRTFSGAIGALDDRINEIERNVIVKTDDNQIAELESF